MSFAKSKNDFSKKDMNFFSEFSSGASQQITSAFPIFLLLAVLILGITAIIFIVCAVQVNDKQGKIDDIRAEMASEEYQQRLNRKDKSQIEVEDLRQTHYVLSSLDAKVSDRSVSSVENLEKCKNALPADAVMTSYHDSKGTIEIVGVTLTCDSAFNYGKKLDETDLFSFTEQSISIFDPIENGYDKESLMFGMLQYDFTYKCTLNGHYTLSYASFVDGTTPAPLTQLETLALKSGEEYNIGSIVNKNVDGVNYQLTNIKINDTAIDANKLAEYTSSDSFYGRIGSNMDVKFMYTAIDDTTDGGES